MARGERREERGERREERNRKRWKERDDRVGGKRREDKAVKQRGTRGREEGQRTLRR